MWVEMSFQIVSRKNTKKIWKTFFFAITAVEIGKIAFEWAKSNNIPRSFNKEKEQLDETGWRGFYIVVLYYLLEHQNQRQGRVLSINQKSENTLICYHRQWRK